MEVNFTSKHITVEDEVKAKAQTMIERFAADYATQKVTGANILFSAERGLQIVEILVNAKNLKLHAAAKQDNMFAALAKAFEKLNTQMSRFLTKLRDASTKADPTAKDKIWRSTDLSEAGEDDDVADYQFGIDE